MLRIHWIASFCAVGIVVNSVPAIAQVSCQIEPAQIELGQIEPVQIELAQTESEQAEPEDKPKRSYIGIGGNIGLSGDETSIGDGGFTIVTRTRIIDYLSVRGSIIFGGETTSATALTGEVPLKNGSGDIVAIPFLGGGISIADSDVNPLISTGVDVPLGEDFTVTNRVNVSFGDDETDVGLLVGVGYNFTLF
ncbi:MAG: hypothetical protein AAF171_19810 [Cyanobacteria bacterium P01_A01_bin.116]